MQHVAFIVFQKLQFCKASWSQTQVELTLVARFLPLFSVFLSVLLIHWLWNWVGILDRRSLLRHGAS